ncbi:MAG: efflux RND transporter periplasmic adaptor subunit [Myxococcota bacterium]|nr:efflux RND transporter periplasmic adaptor subunit [Myxococcota bacterium]
MTQRRDAAVRAATLAAALMVLAILGGCRNQEAELLTVLVERGEIEATVSATGSLNPVHMVEVGTRTSGRIESIDVDYNTLVQKGQRVAKIDPSNSLIRVQKARAAVLSAEAGVEQANADLSLKRDQLARQRSLHGESLITHDRLDLAETVYAQSQAELSMKRASLAQAHAELEDAEVNLSYTDVVSPVDGIVLSKNVNVGQTVAASFQTPTLFLIAQDLTQMQVNADVSESDIGQVREAQSARFHVDAYPDRVFVGRVRQVRNSPMSVQNVVTYDVVIDVDNSDLALRPGMTATVTLVTDTKADVLKVPLRALRFRPKSTDSSGWREKRVGDSSSQHRSRLWIRGEGGMPSAVPIDTGVRDDEHVEVVSGEISEGDEVIIGYRRPS